jgi:hypothetical protein
MGERGISVLDPERASLIGRIGAHRLHATHDSREITTKARETFLASFEREVDPGFVLPEAERVRRAAHARKAYFARLAMRSAQVRSTVKEATHAA